MISRRSFTSLAALGGLSAALGLPRSTATATTGVSRQPVVAELFTSQGCSSCPPADAHLGKLSTRDDVIALAYHVDYWDYIGWPDPFADAAYTARQRGYRPRLGNGSIYTPQMVIDGAVDVVGSRAAQVDALIRQRLDAEVSTRASIPVHAELSGGALTAEIPSAGIRGRGEVFMVAYDAQHVTEVRRGENGGRTLIDRNVVRELRLIARYDGKGGAIRVEPGSWSEREGGVAVLLQAADHGPIWGAAQLLLS